MATGLAPGRCTLAGEHVDYADGLVLCLGVDLHVAAAARRADAGRWLVRSGERRATRREDREPLLRGDVADRVLACAVALRQTGLAVPPCEVGLAADLPEAAGLSSSAALSAAVLVALLRLLGARLEAGRLSEVALHAERDVLGVPCGPLDQRAVTLAPARGALLLDCRSGAASVVPWGLAGVGLVACHSGDVHDVGGAGYRARREQVAAALAALGAGSWRDLRAADLDAARLPEPLAGRARHIVTETGRAAAAAAALARGDAVTLGGLMSASHASLRDDYEVSTAALDAAVTAAVAVPGCLGARLVGAGFGGTAIALVADAQASACLAAMTAACAERSRGAWRLAPAAGVAGLAADVIDG